jgi:hypothetical protein
VVVAAVGSVAAAVAVVVADGGSVELIVMAAFVFATPLKTVVFAKTAAEPAPMIPKTERLVTHVCFIAISS